MRVGLALAGTDCNHSSKISGPHAARLDRCSLHAAISQHDVSVIYPWRLQLINARRRLVEWKDDSSRRTWEGINTEVTEEVKEH